MNSAVERVVDLASPTPHPTAAKAKDLAAGAALLASLGAVGVACFLFGPKLIALL